MKIWCQLKTIKDDLLPKSYGRNRCPVLFDLLVTKSLCQLSILVATWEGQQPWFLIYCQYVLPKLYFHNCCHKYLLPKLLPNSVFCWRNHCSALWHISLVGSRQSRSIFFVIFQQLLPNSVGFVAQFCSICCSILLTKSLWQLSRLAGSSTWGGRRSTQARLESF